MKSRQESKKDIVFMAIVLLAKEVFGINALIDILSEETVNAFYDQHLSPTYVPLLAKRIVRIIERGEWLTGLLHLAGDRLSRYEFALLIARILRKDESLVKPVSMRDVKLRARRPKDSSLAIGKARKLGLALPPQSETIKTFIKDFLSLKV